MVDLQEAPVDGHDGQGEGGGHEGLVVLQTGILAFEEEGQALFLSGLLCVCHTAVVLIVVVVVVDIVSACIQIGAVLAAAAGAVAATSTTTAATAAATRAATGVVVGDLVVATATATATATARRESVVVHALNVGF